MQIKNLISWSLFMVEFSISWLFFSHTITALAAATPGLWRITPDVALVAKLAGRVDSVTCS